jgi:hypothetical protein
LQRTTQWLPPPAPGHPTVKSRIAIFNRNILTLRKQWLEQAAYLIEIIPGRFGEAYFNDLSPVQVAIKGHLSDHNLGDFESGIFEAMAQGCVVVSDGLDERTVAEIAMDEAILQVD